jgi:tetratricopeptide (TPR) repeat protein
MGALDELLSAWRTNPDAEATLALCSYLGVSGREELIREVGASATTWHQNDAQVMLATGRMYLDAGMLVEAQAALVAAGKANPQDGAPFRYLGEVLLRRGDAQRAERVLARAVQLGKNDSDTRLWRDRAVVYVALQKRVGQQAVANEVMRTLPPRPSILPPMAQPAAPAPGAWPSDEEPTAMRSPSSVPAPAAPAPTPARSAATAPPRAPLQPVPRKETLPPKGARPRSVPPPLPEVPAAKIPSVVPEALAGPRTGGVRPAVTPWSPPAAVMSPPTPLGSLGLDAPAAPGPEPAPAPASAPGSRPYAPSYGDDATTSMYDSLKPEPDVVLESLARVGVYEPGGGAPPAWERAAPQKSRGTWVFVLATVLLVGGGVGAYKYAMKVKRQRMELAAHLTDEVDRLLHDGRIDDLKATDEKLARIFDLDSRSQRAARLWLENRVLDELLLPGAAHGIDAAVYRTHVVGLPEKSAVFGRIASFLANGDLAGAAALLPRYDKTAGDDAFYQLVAGATLERAGDLRSIERYQAARDRDPELIPAQVLLARVVLLEAGPEKAKPILDKLQSEIGNRADMRALLALNWAVNPDRPQDLPKGLELSQADRDSLPDPLKSIPYIVDALKAISAGQRKAALDAIQKGIGLSEAPDVATRLGFLAIQAGDEHLARTAALRALQFAAVYPQARVLASRVALLGGRLDEATKAIEELDPKTPDVAIVHAVIAYETLDPSDLQSSVEALGDAVNSRPALAGLGSALKVIEGQDYPKPDELQSMSRSSVPWGELVAADAALDTGNLDLADKLVSAWPDTSNRPVFAVRVARLRRYQGKNDEALRASDQAMSQGNVTARDLIERVYDLLAAGDVKGAHDVVAKYSTLLGPMTAWLQVLVNAPKHRAEANVKAAQLDLPPDAAPVLLRVMVARALAAAKDKRAVAYARGFKRSERKNPDVVAALKAK